MIWATRTGCHVDRAACAWLIRRSIDPEPTFIFVGTPGTSPRAQPRSTCVEPTCRTTGTTAPSRPCLGGQAPGRRRSAPDPADVEWNDEGATTMEYRSSPWRGSICVRHPDLHRPAAPHQQYPHYQQPQCDHRGCGYA